MLFMGAKGMLLSDYDKHVLLPEKKFADQPVAKANFPKPMEHHAEWINACKTGAPTGAPFDYGGRLTEANHLASIAYRLGKKLEWDAVSLRCTNAPEADRLIRREYRKGWVL